MKRINVCQRKYCREHATFAQFCSMNNKNCFLFLLIVTNPSRKNLNIAKGMKSIRRLLCKLATCLVVKDSRKENVEVVESAWKKTLFSDVEEQTRNKLELQLTKVLTSNLIQYGGEEGF